MVGWIPDKYDYLNDITDVSGLRIITYFEDDVDNVASLIENEFYIDRKNSIDKRTSLDPDRFGYLSLHYVVKLNKDRLKLTENKNFQECVAEVQIRSILQHAWAEIEHDLGYKTKEEIPKHIRRQFSRLAGLLELADKEFVSVRKQLSEYAKQVSDNLSEENESLLLDKITVENFIKKSAFVKDLDSRIAKETNSNLEELDNISTHYVTNILSILKYFDFTTIAETKDTLEQESENIIEFAKKWLEDSITKKTLYEGVSLFYFGYFYAASKNDKSYVINYLEELNIGGNSSKLAEEIIDIYQKVVSQ